MSNIERIKKGAFFLVSGHVYEAGEDAHQNFDEPDEPWIVYDTNGDSWFEEDVQAVFDDGDSPDVVMSLSNEQLRTDWYDADEGYNGDYNPDDPEDEPLLRFDVYYKNAACEWEAVEDASYCTCMSLNAPKSTLRRALAAIFNEYSRYDVRNDSVKHVGEELTYMSASTFAEPN